MRKTFQILMLLTVMTGLVACKQKAETPVEDKQKTTLTVGVDEFEREIADPQKVVLVDVRTAEEYAEGHLKEALLIDVKQSTFREECVKQLPKDKTVAVYCRSGFRSKTAAGILNEAGYSVINLGGGYMAWTEAGKETVK